VIGIFAGAINFADWRKIGSRIGNFHKIIATMKPHLDSPYPKILKDGHSNNSLA
jgi:hypothetical protein